jgi:hypothetical protein
MVKPLSVHDEDADYPGTGNQNRERRKEVIMAEENYALKWLVREPPHFVKNFGDIVRFYEIVKEKYQKDIDNAFDSVSEQIGFVVTTMLPVSVVIGRGGKITSMELAEDSLKTSMFNTALKDVLSSISKNEAGFTKMGTYNLIIFWNAGLQALLGATCDPTPEPASPQIEVDIPGEAKVVLSAIDRVYSDLHLGSYISNKYGMAYYERPPVNEPVHFRVEDLLKTQWLGYQPQTKM